MLIANGKNLRSDVLVSCSVLAGLGFTFVLRMPVLDRVTALLVSLWIIKVAAGIFREANTELMDGTEGDGPYGEIFAAVSSVQGAGNPHRTRVRRLGSLLIVDLDIEVEPDLSVAAAHAIAAEVETCHQAYAAGSLRRHRPRRAARQLRGGALRPPPLGSLRSRAV